MVFPGQNLPLPRRPFPFNPSAYLSPKQVPDCHLVRTVIPCLPIYDSLGVFHNKAFRFLASFASMVSRSDYSIGLATTKRCMFLFSHMITQGRLHCTQHAILRTALQVHTRFVRGRISSENLPPSHNTRSPRKPGRMLHAIGARPGSLTPSIHPKLGVKSRHQGLHRCALHGIFRPHLGTGRFD